MEMRPTEMVSLVVVHPNANPIEGADPRHDCISSQTSNLSPLPLIAYAPVTNAMVKPS